MIHTDVFYKVKKYTLTDYDFYQMNNEKEKIMIPDEVMESMIEDLLCELESRDEKIEEIIQDRTDNYRQITPREMYEI